MPTAKKEERPVRFPKIEVFLAFGKDAITGDQARDMLGLVETTEKDKATDPDASALYGKPIKLTNNARNRYFTRSWLLTLKQEHLNRRWRVNGETVVIGETGMTLSAQHRLFSLVLAEMEYNGENGSHWRNLSSTAPTMETVVVYGIKEDDDTFKTLNCGKPGTLSEVLYRSEHLAHIKSPRDRKAVAKITDQAIKLLWARTGAISDPFAPRRTHGEALDFLSRHPRVLRAVKHIHEEDAEDAIGQFLSAGPAAGLLYLMGCSTSEVDLYRNEDPASSEKSLKWDMWEKACEFFVMLGSGSSTFNEVRTAIRGLDNPDTGQEGPVTEKLAVLIKAWALFVAGEDFSAKGLALSYKENDDGVKKLAETPSVGGIDLGNPRDIDVATEEDETPPDEDASDKPKARRVSGKELTDILKSRRNGGKIPEEVSVDKSNDKDGKPPVPKVLAKPLHKREEKATETVSGLAEELAGFRQKHPGYVLLFATGSKNGPKGNLNVYGEDVSRVCKVLGLKPLEHNYGDKIERTHFDAKDLDANVEKLVKAKVPVMMLVDGGKNVVELVPQQKAKTPPKPVKKGTQ